MRSRTQWHQEGEKNYHYFLSLEKRNATRKSVQFIQNENQMITNPKAILELFTETYKEKYSAHEVTMIDTAAIRKNISTKINETERLNFEKPITLAELTIAINTMKKGKTPGSNGFSVDFFRCFWKEVGTFLHRAFISCYTQGKTPPTHRESVITLIPKAGRSSHSLKGWRPISLLNVDYKIISTAVSNRFKQIISKVISPSQSAYIKGRYIGENSRLLYDMIDRVEHQKLPGLVMAADFEAAFETVSWSYLRIVLEELNFGPNFVGLIDTLYLNVQNYSRILLNGFLGEKNIP